jgi:hypothetical protein
MNMKFRKKMAAVIRQRQSSLSATTAKKGSGRIHTYGWNKMDKRVRSMPIHTTEVRR